MSRYFLTGRPGSGKSTVIARLLDLLKGRGVTVAGVLTPELRKDSRQGFEIVDIASGAREVMAEVGLAGPRVSKYGVDAAAVGRIVGKFEASLAGAEVIVIDEIGKMELLSDRFRAALQAAIDSGKPLVATVGRPFAARYGKYGEIIEVTPANREKLADRLLPRLQ